MCLLNKHIDYCLIVLAISQLQNYKLFIQFPANTLNFNFLFCNIYYLAQHAFCFVWVKYLSDQLNQLLLLTDTVKSKNSPLLTLLSTEKLLTIGIIEAKCFQFLTKYREIEILSVSIFPSTKLYIQNILHKI